MKFDHQIVNKYKKYLYVKIINRFTRWISIKYYLNNKINSNYNYAFYPLHTEPELTINVYAKEFLNQIEVIRLISNSLPIDMRLLVKEHPATLGKRSINYYKKIAEIPNVILLKHDYSVFDIINKSKIVFVITGTTALEAIYLKKPVIFFGKVPYDFLPNHIVQKANIYSFSNQINDFLSSYKWDESTILNYISSVLLGSSEVNLITEVLRKKNRLNNNVTNSYENNIIKLAENLYNRLIEEEIIEIESEIINR